MTQEQIEDLMLVGKFMEIKNLFPYRSPNGQDLGVYKAQDEDGTICYADGINWYSPHHDWNILMDVVDKIRTIQLPSPSMIPVSVVIDNYGCRITDGCWNSAKIIENTITENPNVKELTYKSVVEFIKWHNELNK